MELADNPISGQYSMYGHIRQLAIAEKEGIEAAGGKADLYQCVNRATHSLSASSFVFF